MSTWKIVLKQKQVRYLREAAEEMSLAGWMDLYEEAEGSFSREEWRARYESRADEFRYVHLYYYLKKA